MASYEGLSAQEIEEKKNKQIRKIWLVAGYLAVITAIEFAIAFTSIPKGVKNITFIVLTIVKAFFIVAEFMHLRHEVKMLMYAVVLPMAFVLWLILALLIEADAIFNVLFGG